MADFNSKQNVAGASRPLVPTPGTETGAKLVTYRGSIDANHGFTLAQNDRIKLFTQPVPNLYRPLFLVITHGAFGAGVTLDVGTTADPDELVDGLNIAAAGRSVVVALTTDQLDADREYFATFIGANPADDQALSVELICAGYN